MSVLFNGAVSGSSSVDTGDIGHSLRFRSGSYLTRTPGSSGSRRKLTVSMWVKRCALGVFQRTFGADDIGSTTFCVGFNTNNKLEIRDFSGGYLIQGISTQVFRDTTSFIHLVVAFDTDQATFANGVKAYVNGTQITAWDTSTYSGVHDLQINDTRKQSFGVYLVSGSPSAPFDYGLDYLARACIVTGSQEAPTSFAYLNTEINEWVSKSQSAVKAVVDAGGTNSFMLDFDNGSSLTTLGYDKSSKGNNWTLNNFSLTAGTTYDHMLDVPGNSFATANPLDKGNVTIADGNLKVTHTTYQDWWRGSVGVSSGKWAWEVTATSSSSGSPYEIGVAKSTGVLTTDPLAQSAVYAYYGSSGNKYNGSSAAYGATYTAGDVIRVELDLDAGTLVFFKNGTSQGTAYTGLSGTFFAMTGCGSGGVTQVTNLNFGQAPLHASATYHSAAGGYFRDAPTTGFKALCQRNLPDPAILNPELHFDVKLDTGVNIKTTMDALFSGNVFEWIKDRANSNNHQLADVNRGLTAILQSNTTAAETTYSAPSGSSVGWGWKMGGAAVTNNSGSISSQVSANVLAGQSVVTATCQGSGTATVGHGLGKAPALILYKRRGAASSWGVYHHALGPGQYVLLESSAALVSDTTVWNNTLPTSSVFTLGTPYAGLGDYVFLCFAEIPGFSKLRYYTGNGSADGPVVECGFKPKYVLIKGAGNASNWNTFDGERSPSNLVDDLLRLNLADAENVSGGTSIHVDFTATGFKIRGGSVDLNANGVAYIFYAIADVAGKYALGR